jgi:hypothetical protein
MKEKLVTVARFSDYVEADLARQMLEAEGITAFVMGQNVGNVYAGVPAAIDIQLQTPESQAERAIEILEAREQDAAEADEEDRAQDWDEDVEDGQDEDLEQE